MSQFSRGWSPLPGEQAPTQNPPGVSPGGWYFVCNPLNPGLNGVFPMITDPSAQGPYQTQAEAQSAYQLACATTPQQPPTGSAPPTPGVSTYFNVCYDAGGGGAGIIQVLAQTSSGAMGQVAGAKAAFGPYNGLLAAQNASATDLQNCPNLPAPSPSCVVSPLFNCPAPPPGIVGLGTPGTAEWCQAMNIIVAEVGKIGVQVLGFLDGMLDTNKRIANIDDYLNQSGISPVTNGVVKVIRQVFCWIGPYIETLRQSITCFRQWMQALYPKCNNEAEWGLIVIRSLLVSLEHWEFGTDAAVWLIAKSGIAIDPLMQTIDYLIAYACPIRLPSEAETIEAYKYNNIDEDVAKCILQAHGLQWDTAAPGIMARGDKPGWREAIQYIRRVQGEGGAEDGTLRNLGILDPSYRDLLRTVYDELPTVSDHLEFLRKNVFDDQYVKDFRLMEGFEDRFWTKFGGQLRALGMTKETAGLHYAAHWINPSFQQQFQMVQRLRPGRAPANLQFTRADLLRTMQEMDVGAYFRERLEAVSHPVPNLTLCLQMYQFGTVDDAEFVEKLKDLGFDDTNAVAILEAQRIKVRRLNASSGHGWTPAAMAQAYAIGKLTDQQIDDEMRYLGYSQEDANRLKRRSEIELAIAPVKRLMQSSIRSALTTQSNAYKCGAIDGEQLRAAYRNAGIPDNVAQVGVSDVDASVAVDICRKQVASFRSALLRGKVNVEQLRGIMTGAGMPQLRVEQLLKSWVIEAGLRAPQATAAQILRWVGQGLLDRDTALSRLLNLGWTDPDLALMLAESLAKRQAAQTRIQAQAARSQQAAARAALRLAQENETAANRLRSKLKGIASRSTLQKWYKEGLIDDGYFIDAMKARGFDDDSTLKYLAESQAARLKAAKPPQPKPPQGAQTNGTPAGQ